MNSCSKRSLDDVLQHGVRAPNDARLILRKGRIKVVAYRRNCHDASAALRRSRMWIPRGRSVSRGRTDPTARADITYAFVSAYAASSLQPQFDLSQVARRAVEDHADIYQQPDGHLRREPWALPFCGKCGGVLELAGQPREEFLDLDLLHLKSPPRPTGVRTACRGVEVQSFRSQAALFSSAVILRLRAAGPRSHSRACGASSRVRGGPVPGPPVGPARRTGSDWVLPADRVLWPRSAAPCGRA